MSIDFQVHHILPTQVYNRFKREIKSWTDGEYDQNAGYNMTPLCATTSGAAAMNLPMHLSQHPWLNRAFSAVLTQIARERVDKATKYKMFRGAHSYFRSALDYTGKETRNNYTFLSRDDPKAKVHFGNVAPDADKMYEYYEESHSIENMLTSQAYAKGFSGEATNGAFGSLNADKTVYETSSQRHDAEGYRTACGLRADEQDDRTFRTSLASVYSGVRSQSIPDLVKTELARRILRPEPNEGADGPGGSGTDRSMDKRRPATFDDAFKAASDFVDRATAAGFAIRPSSAAAAVAKPGVDRPTLFVVAADRDADRPALLGTGHLGDAPVPGGTERVAWGSLVVETALSGPAALDLMDDARRTGLRVELHYVATGRPDGTTDRDATGDGDGPRRNDPGQARRHLAEAIAKADRATLHDAGGEVAELSPDRYTFADKPPNWAAEAAYRAARLAHRSARTPADLNRAFARALEAGAAAGADPATIRQAGADGLDRASTPGRERSAQARRSRGEGHAV